MSKNAKQIKVGVATDELYPVYSLETINENNKNLPSLKISKKLFDEYQQTMKKYNELHLQIRKLVEEQLGSI
jgi:predicted secreted Zn-dependent protease